MSTPRVPSSTPSSIPRVTPRVSHRVPSSTLELPSSTPRVALRSTGSQTCAEAPHRIVAALHGAHAVLVHPRLSVPRVPFEYPPSVPQSTLRVPVRLLVAHPGVPSQYPQSTYQSTRAPSGAGGIVPTRPSWADWCAERDRYIIYHLYNAYRQIGAQNSIATSNI